MDKSIGLGNLKVGRASPEAAPGDARPTRTVGVIETDQRYLYVAQQQVRSFF
jgi:hypothetical protein